MKLMQETQMLSELVSIVVKTSSRCSIFTSSDVIHCVASKLGMLGSILTDIREQQCSFVTRSSGDILGSSGER